MSEDSKKRPYAQIDERPAWISPHQPVLMSEWYRPASKQVQPFQPKDVQIDSRAYLRQKVV